jgi:monovalent cation:H+ antiporter-2, CPA2 family
MGTAAHNSSAALIELGAAIVGLAILARIASRLGFSAIPLYLVAGLAFGNGGLAPLPFSQEFIHVGAEIGVLLLLFMLGLEYTGDELKANLRRGFSAGVIDLLLDFTPGLLAGFLLGWKPIAAVLLGGVTYISSSGIVAKVLAELRRLENPETALVMSVLVFEDLVMAVYLPLVGVFLAGGGPSRMAAEVAIAIVTVIVVLIVAVRYGNRLSRIVAHESDEVVLLTTFGAVLLVAGMAERFQVSAAIGAFLVGIAISGPIAKHSHQLLAPLRDLFAATFFFFFGLQVAPATLLPVLPLAVALAFVTILTKVLAGYIAGRGAGLENRAAFRGGMTLVARGEFSIVIAGLGAGVEPQLGPLSTCYVLLLAMLGPLLTRWSK